jgi:hypothetical protein
MEDLHLDVFEQRKDFQWLRVFWNADSFPRIWMCGIHLDDLLSDSSIQIDRSRHPEIWNKQLNRSYFGEAKGIAPSDVPFHTVLLAPGAIWLAHSEYIPHGPIIGRRMVSFTFLVDPETMIDPALCFNRLPERLGR